MTYVTANPRVNPHHFLTSVAQRTFRIVNANETEVRRDGGGRGKEEEEKGAEACAPSIEGGEGSRRRANGAMRASERHAAPPADGQLARSVDLAAADDAGKEKMLFPFRPSQVPGLRSTVQVILENIWLAT